jgi:hypothetical protein
MEPNSSQADRVACAFDATAKRRSVQSAADSVREDEIVRTNEAIPWAAGHFASGSDGTRTRDLRRDRPEIVIWFKHFATERSRK